MKKPENIPAFPIVDPQLRACTTGMSLRDYFAAAALQGMLANQDIQKHFRKNPASNVHEINAVAAFEAADEMLKRRKW